MSRSKTSLSKLTHSNRFMEILRGPNPEVDIRAVTHSDPILVFWVTPSGKVLDAGEAHHQNPPDGDRTILSDKTHKGHLRGRSAFIGDKLYIVIYGDSNKEVTPRQLLLLRSSYPPILNAIKAKISDKYKVADAIFINENGDTMEIR